MKSQRPVRDRPTWISYIQIGTYAWFLYSFGATVALLRDEQLTSPSVAALHSTMLAVGSIAGGILTRFTVDRVGRGRAIRAASIGSAIGMLVYTIPATPVAVTLIGMLLVGFFGGGMLIITVNSYVLEHQHRAGPAALTEANAIAALAGLVGPLIVGIGAATLLGWRTAVWIAVATLLILEFARGRDLADYDQGEHLLARPRHEKLPARTYWAVAAVVAFLSSEFCMTLWSADLLRVRSGLGPAAAAASIAAITGGMFIGRTAGATLAQRFSTETLLPISIIIALAGFALAWIPTWAPLVITGLFVVGLGLSVHWPLGVSRAVRAADGHTDRASALSSIWGSIGVGVAPFILGALAGTIGFHRAFLLVPVFLVTALAIVLLKPVAEGLSSH